ncbi:TIR domain-containing protein [Actinokineospora guangxiensis]|uniref:TIR domain-containing protein n=1 Tax=Actinokineospora guangxiensis TaxID=1490288 RepID=A0ABW0EXK4_9PSEU
MSALSTDYDIAVSFTYKHRAYVEAVVGAAKALGLRVFYDRDMATSLWGQNFVTAFRKIYSSRAQFCVPFISAEYFSAPYARDEFFSAMLKAVEQGDGYILPVLMDSSPIPSELLSPHIGYLRAVDHTPEQLAGHLHRKVLEQRAPGGSPGSASDFRQSHRSETTQDDKTGRGAVRRDGLYAKFDSEEKSLSCFRFHDRGVASVGTVQCLNGDIASTVQDVSRWLGYAAQYGSYDDITAARYLTSGNQVRVVSTSPGKVQYEGIVSESSDELRLEWYSYITDRSGAGTWRFHAANFPKIEWT